MAMYVAGYASTTTNRTQSAPTGSSNSTTLAVTERAALRTTSTQLLTASSAAVSTATWTLQRNNSTIGSITITAGQTSGTTSLSAEQRLEPGDELKVIAPAGSPLPSGATLTMTWRFSLAAWVLVPQEPNKLYVNNGGTWTSAKEAWVAEETTPGVYQWAKAWRVPTPPAGVKPDLEQWDSGSSTFDGGDVRASFINPNTEYQLLVSFERDRGSGYSVIDNISVSIGGVEAISNRSNYENGDNVRARTRYFEGGVQGDWSAYSDVLSYFKSGF
jgi:hypothetical protein